MRSFDEAQERIPNQRQRIADMLRAAGDVGVTNKQLSNVSLQYSARIHELIKSGYVIDNDRTEQSGIYRYYLRKMPTKEHFFMSAEDIVLNAIDLEYEDGKINSLELKMLLNINNFHIKRRANWYRENMQ